jgi:hypothetical protein
VSTKSITLYLEQIGYVLSDVEQLVITRAYPDDNPTDPSTSDTDDQPAAPGTAQ